VTLHRLIQIAFHLEMDLFSEKSSFSPFPSILIKYFTNVSVI